MGNGSYDLPHVATVWQRGDDSIVVYLQTDSFHPGQEVEVSVNLTQGSAYAVHYEKKRIPLPELSNLEQAPEPSNPEQPAVLHVELPTTKLDEGQAVTVITRVTEVWPTVLQPDSKQTELYKPQGIKAIWTYQDSGGKGPGDPGSPPSGN